MYQYAKTTHAVFTRKLRENPEALNQVAKCIDGEIKPIRECYDGKTKIPLKAYTIHEKIAVLTMYKTHGDTYAFAFEIYTPEEETVKPPVKTINDYVTSQLHSQTALEYMSKIPVKTMSNPALDIVIAYMILRDHGLPYPVNKIAKWLKIHSPFSITLAKKTIRELYKPSTASIDIDKAKTILEYLGYSENIATKTIELCKKKKHIAKTPWITPLVATCLHLVSEDPLVKISALFDISVPVLRKIKRAIQEPVESKS